MRMPRVQVVEYEKFDLTPMIDIVLLLIIFFTMTASFAAATRSFMDLPRERGRETPASPASLFIDVARDGSLTLLDTRVDMDGLRYALQAELARGTEGIDADVIVRADRLAPAAHLNRLAGVLARSGVTRWKLATTGDGPAPAVSGGVGGGAGAQP
jgi:biopolymer transport protein ExbD